MEKGMKQVADDKRNWLRRRSPRIELRRRPPKVVGGGVWPTLSRHVVQAPALRAYAHGALLPRGSGFSLNFGCCRGFMLQECVLRVRAYGLERIRCEFRRC